MICVTAAGGTLSSEVIEQLTSLRVPFRAAYHSETKAEAARGRGIRAVTADYGDRDSLRAAFTGCEKVFLLGPNVEDQTELETNAVEEARRAGVRAIVKLSVLGADDPGFSLGRVHGRVEQAIQSSGLDWTFLRSNSFMQNVTKFMAPTIRAEGVFYSASGDAKISHVDVRDIASVAVKALTEPSHAGRYYELTGPDALSYDEMSQHLTLALGRPVQHVALTPDDLRAGMLAEGMPPVLADRLLDLERYFREGRASRVTDDVERVSGKRARSFASYARDCADALR